MTDGRCPHALTVLGLIEYFLGLLLLQGVADNLPVHEIAGMEDGQSRNAIKRRGRQEIVIANGTHVRVAVIGIEDGIRVGAVATIRRPHLRVILSHCTRGAADERYGRKDLLHLTEVS